MRITYLGGGWFSNIAACREEWPDTSMVEEVQGKHRKIVLSYKDQSRLVVMANTPSDKRALPNHIATGRRELRGMGAAKRHPQVTPKPERAFKPFAPAVQKPFEGLEVIMKPTNKIEAIFSAIGDLRYGEMLALSQLLSAAASDAKMRRSVPNDWAKVLHSVAGAPNVADIAT